MIWQVLDKDPIYVLSLKTQFRRKDVKMEFPVNFTALKAGILKLL